MKARQEMSSKRIHWIVAQDNLWNFIFLICFQISSFLALFDKENVWLFLEGWLPFQDWNLAHISNGYVIFQKGAKIFPLPLANKHVFVGTADIYKCAGVVVANSTFLLIANLIICNKHIISDFFGSSLLVEKNPLNKRMYRILIVTMIAVLFCVQFILADGMNLTVGEGWSKC